MQRLESEAGFESGGQSREQALLVPSLGVKWMAVAVNKMDTVSYKNLFVHYIYMCVHSLFI